MSDYYLEQPQTLPAALEIIRRLTVERMSLYRQLADLIHENAAVTAQRDTVIGERDRARGTAVLLEQESAEVRAYVTSVADLLYGIAEGDDAVQRAKTVDRIRADVLAILGEAL